MDDLIDLIDDSSNLTEYEIINYIVNNLTDKSENFKNFIIKYINHHYRLDQNISNIIFSVNILDKIFNDNLYNGFNSGNFNTDRIILTDNKKSNKFFKVETKIPQDQYKITKDFISKNDIIKSMYNEIIKKITDILINNNDVFVYLIVYTINIYQSENNYHIFNIKSVFREKTIIDSRKEKLNKIMNIN